MRPEGELTEDELDAWWGDGGGRDQPTIIIEWNPGPIRLEVAVVPGNDPDEVCAEICTRLNDCMNYDPDDPEDGTDNTPVQMWDECWGQGQTANIVRCSSTGSSQAWWTVKDEQG